MHDSYTLGLDINYGLGRTGAALVVWATMMTHNPHPHYITSWYSTQEDAKYAEK